MLSNTAETGSEQSLSNYQPIVVDCFARLVDGCGTATASTASAAGFRERAFRKVVDDMRAHFGADHPLVSMDQLKGRTGYGKGTLKRIEEILQTGTLAELNSAPDGTRLSSSDTQDRRTRAQTSLDLQQVTGIGPTKAKKLALAGITRVQLGEWLRTGATDELKSAELTHHQLLGLKYFEDLSHRIPRHVISRFDAVLQRLCAPTTVMNPGGTVTSKKAPVSRRSSKTASSRNKTPKAPTVARFPSIATICGSYRRGNTDSGDIDVLVSDPSWKTPAHARDGLRWLLEALAEQQLLVEDLTDRSKVTTKYMGFVRMPQHKWVLRLDVRAVVRAQYAPALAYFTGSKEENVRLRTIALARHMRLNEYGLTRLTAENGSGPSDTKQTSPGQRVPVHTEEELYRGLGEPYIPPVER